MLQSSEIFVASGLLFPPSYILLAFEGLYFVNNSLLYNGEYEVAFYCRMIFEKYPLDAHVCDFKLTSFSYDSSVINFTLNKLLFEESQQVSLLDYSISVDHLPQSKRGSSWM